VKKITSNCICCKIWYIYYIDIDHAYMIMMWPKKWPCKSRTYVTVRTRTRALYMYYTPRQDPELRARAQFSHNINFGLINIGI
jgi:hypothetical protein